MNKNSIERKVLTFGQRYKLGKFLETHIQSLQGLPLARIAELASTGIDLLVTPDHVSYAAKELGLPIRTRHRSADRSKTDTNKRLHRQDRTQARAILRLIDVLGAENDFHPSMLSALNNIAERWESEHAVEQEQ
ncbi:MAG: hypothetical protein M0Q49_01780 [Porticoccaceae bacterium]|nr:hypothetical protein [Porticoccaceae bacterium]